MGLINQKQNWCYYFDLDHTEKGCIVEKRECPQQFLIRDWNDGWHHYYVEVKSSKSFAFVNLKKYIPLAVLEQIKDPNSKVLLHICNSHEAFFDMPREVYHHVCFPYDIPTHKVVLSNGAFDLINEVDKVCLENNVPPFKVELVLDFELAQVSDINKGQREWKTLEPSQIKKSFLLMNRRWRLHRPLLVAYLYGKGVLDKGFVSLAQSDDNRNWGDHVPAFKEDGCTPNENPNEEGIFGWMEYFCESNRDLHDAIIPNKKAIQALPPMYLDNTDLVTNRARFTWRPGWLYQQSLFSVVTETNYFTTFHPDDTKERSIFLSEKIFKPIAFKHPFIVVAPPGTLKALKSIGYRTFGSIIDESYDDEKDDLKRIVKVGNEIVRLSNLTQEQIVEFCDAVRDTCDHNSRVMERRRNFNYKINY